MPGKEPRRSSLCFMVIPSLIDSLRVFFGGTAGGDDIDSPPRIPHEPKNAFARRLELTLAKVAAASESFSFSAYPQILVDAEVGVPAWEPADSSLATDDDREGRGGCGEGGCGDGDREIAGDKGDSGDGGASIDDWFVIPLQTVLAKRDVNVLGLGGFRGVSVSLPSSAVSSSSLDSSSSDGDGERSGEVWLVKPFHIVTFSRAPRLSELPGAISASSSRRFARSDAV